MKKIAVIIFLFCSLQWICGCTILGVQGIVGEELDAEHLQTFAGQWIREDGRTISVAEVEGESFLRVRYPEEGEVREGYVYPRLLEEGTILFWAETDYSGFYTPARLMHAEGAVILLLPEIRIFHRLLESGTLREAKERVDGPVLLVEPNGIEAVLAGKEAWRMEYGFLLIKEDSPILEPNRRGH